MANDKEKLKQYEIETSGPAHFPLSDTDRRKLELWDELAAAAMAGYKRISSDYWKWKKELFVNGQLGSEWPELKALHDILAKAAELEKKP